MAKDNKSNTRANGRYVTATPYKPSRFERFRYKTNTFIDNHSNGLKGILSLILSFLIIVALYRVSTGKNIPLFGDFLNILTTMPTLNIPMLSSVANISAESLGVFSFLLPIIDISMTILDMLVFLVNGATNIIIFAFHFVKWIFAIP